MKSNYFVIFILFLAILIIVIFLNTGDSSSKIKNVAFVSLSKVDSKTFSGFKDEMEKLGWEEGKNINYLVTKPAGKIENLEGIVSEVVSKKPDLIFVSSTPATQAVKKAVEGKNIPVVFCPVNDPVSSKIITNPMKPEGMITGVRLAHNDDKRFEWLLKIVPEAKNILIPYTLNDDSSRISRESIKKVLSQFNVNVIEHPFSSEQSFEQLPKYIDAIFIPRDSKMEAMIKEFSQYSILNKIPLSVPSYQLVEQGALFAYGFIHYNLGKDAASYVNRILKGVSVHDLPVKVGESHLVLNTTVAHQIGIKFSSEVLRNAKIVLK